MEENMDQQPRCNFIRYHAKDEQTKQKQKHQIEMFGNMALQRQEGFDYTGKYFYIFEDSSSASANFGYTHMCWDSTKHCRICQSDVNIHFFHSKESDVDLKLKTRRSEVNGCEVSQKFDNFKVSDDSKQLVEIDESNSCDENDVRVSDSSKGAMLSYSKITFYMKTPLAASERRRTLYDSVNNQLIFIVEPKTVDSNDRMCIRIYQCSVTDVTCSRVEEFDLSSDGSNTGNSPIKPGLNLNYKGNSEFHYQLYEDQNHKIFLGVFAKGDQTDNGFMFDMIEIQGRSKMKVCGTRVTVNVETTFRKMTENRQNSDRANNNNEGQNEHANVNNNNNTTSINKENDAKSGRIYMRKVMNMVEECKIRFYIQNNGSNVNSIFFTNLPESRDILECDVVLTPGQTPNNKITRYTLEDEVDTGSFQHCKDNLFMSYAPQTGDVNILQLKSGSIYKIKTISLQKHFGDTVQNPTTCRLVTPFPGKYIVDAEYEDKDNSMSIR